MRKCLHKSQVVARCHVPLASDNLRQFQESTPKPIQVTIIQGQVNELMSRADR